ncbi:hypothetical protein [Neptunomonas antarctica]|uniref:Uncharacterized protein n=1 Tax=Neptunomonas antarctica TaxID=619304 RepID=A0A1N7NNP4_9GAMM|nr:hypothetical protein [Neptunomonas antarctica]SIS99917.1 hypothetical protein SAMN05421760_11091 [Neptunomonas antarctica]
MARSVKSIIFIILAPLILAGLGIGGYFLYQSINAQQATNTKDLELFGYGMVASSQSMASVGVTGTNQLPPTFDEKTLTPTQKVIHGLIRDKDNLLLENKVLQNDIETLKAQLTELTNYKQFNEHFAPQHLKDELKSVEHQLKALLIRTPEAERFSTMQIEIMSAAGAAEYKVYITRNRLMLSEDKKQIVVSDYLPAYAFCVGDAVDIAANTRSEERELAGFFRTNDSSGLSEALLQDLSSVLSPCQLSVRQKLDNDNV